MLCYKSQIFYRKFRNNINKITRDYDTRKQLDSGDSKKRDSKFCPIWLKAKDE